MYTKIKDDQLIFEEKSEAFTVGIDLSSDDKYFFINTSDHNTSEQYYFEVTETEPKPKLIKKYLSSELKPIPTVKASLFSSKIK